MQFKLRILRGKLTDRKGDQAGAEIDVRAKGFLVGTAADCHLRCQSVEVRSHHAKLSIRDDTLWIENLDDESGTFVNDARIEIETELSHADRLRLGRLEFEVMAIAPAEATQDPMSDFVSDMLDEADLEERNRRLEDPSSRRFQVESQEEEVESEPKQKPKPQRPPKRPPQKLPPPPDYVADNTIEAAEETLKKIFDRPKK